MANLPFFAVDVHPAPFNSTSVKKECKPKERADESLKKTSTILDPSQHLKLEIYIKEFLKYTVNAVWVVLFPADHPSGK